MNRPDRTVRFTVVFFAGMLRPRYWRAAPIKADW